jgi:hypothetical protein
MPTIIVQMKTCALEAAPHYRLPSGTLEQNPYTH